MKKLLVLIVFVLAATGLHAQHYGGFTFTPYAVENFDAFRPSSNTSYYLLKGDKVTFGYSLGYQGLVMPQKRFSFSYGLQYSSINNCGVYDEPIIVNDIEGQYLKTRIGQRMDMDLLEVPLWWRYNIIKNKRWRPFIAASTTVNYILKYQSTFLFEDAPEEKQDSNYGFLFSLDIGVGVNYTSDDWMLTIQPTVGGFKYRRLGIALSVMKKF